MNRLRVLVSAYACEPGKGSEPGVGWNLARELASHHEVWVLTRANNQHAIEHELARKPVQGLHFVYYDLPRWSRFWKRGSRGVQLYYYLWQLSAIGVLRRLHAELGFDIVHHVTFVKYWAPSAAAFVGAPFVWGPVGGGENTPVRLLGSMSLRSRCDEELRTRARRLGERDPFVRFAAKTASVAFATTPETAYRLKALGVQDVRILPQVALGCDDLTLLGEMGVVERTDGVVERTDIAFLCLGRLLGLKGTHLAIRAFAHANIDGAVLRIVGDGPERARLEKLASGLGLANRVVFRGTLPRAEALIEIKKADVLVHPTFHDSGGWVTLEAMAASKPVICLDSGGPALQVTSSTGIKVAPGDPSQCVTELAQAMQKLAHDANLRHQLGKAGRSRVERLFTWRAKVEQISAAYLDAISACTTIVK